MPSPEVDRVIYKRNPLAEVICQVRFPAILRITAEQPTEFQEAIRERLPLFKEEHSQTVVSTDVAAALGVRPTALASTAYDFGSDDEKCSLKLTRDFLALTSKSYRRWEDFRDLFEVGLAALRDEYRPAFFSRVGLRYRDVIDREELGLGATPWRDLLSERIAAELCELDEEEVHGVEKQVQVLLDNATGVRIQHGLLPFEAGKATRYLIDCDFFTNERTEVGDVLPKANNFNKHARHVFRWCIGPRLHEAMGPEPVDPD